MSKSKWNESFRLKTDSLKGNDGNSLYLSESGLYSLVLHSTLESAKTFKRWVTKDVLPSIIKTRNYDCNMNHKYNETLTFKIENETDVRVKVVSVLKKRFSHSLFTAALGENQCTSAIRIDFYKKVTFMALQT